MTTREALRRLVDELPEHELHTARRFLEYLRVAGTDPVLRAFMGAPIDDEPLMPDEEAAIEEAREAVARGEVEPWEKVRAELFDEP
jgi:hypothetical protein